jgi:hypothetical protein
MAGGHNHTDSCTCPFCLHLGNHLRAEAVLWRRATKYSFTVPNARCPECSLPVFYYESEHGGRVYFDRLGIPWPKHPCTDKGKPPRKFENWHSHESRLKENASKWRSTGNKPLVCQLIRLRQGDGWTTAVFRDVSTNKEIALDVHTDREDHLMGQPLFATERNGNIITISSPTGNFPCRIATEVKIEDEAQRAKRWLQRTKIRRQRSQSS